MMVQNKLNNIKFVNRIQYLQELCQNKRVLHLGATDSPMTQEAVSRGNFLHLRLKQVSEYIIGMDCDQSTIQWLHKNQLIQNIKYGNIENVHDYPEDKFDVVIAGEIFEHLSNPGKALDAIHSKIQSSTLLIVTVPNTYSIKGFLRAIIFKHELIHPDHTLHHSPHTIKILLERHGFSIKSYFSYVNGGNSYLASLINHFIRFNPQLAEGIGVICQPQSLS